MSLSRLYLCPLLYQFRPALSLHNPPSRCHVIHESASDKDGEKTFFSMVFFHVTDGPEPRLTVNPYWWLYVAVTVPLTALVLAAWLGWMRWKRRGMPNEAEIAVLGEVRDDQDMDVESLIACRGM